jgi:hypothetical protein
VAACFVELWVVVAEVFWVERSQALDDEIELILMAGSPFLSGISAEMGTTINRANEFAICNNRQGIAAVRQAHER